MRTLSTFVWGGGGGGVEIGFLLDQYNFVMVIFFYFHVCASV